FINLRSRDNARTPFPWSNETYAGFSEAEPWLKLTDDRMAVNAQSQGEDKESVLAFYKEMIRFRQSSPYSDCLIYGDIIPLETENKEIIAYRRTYGGENIDCYFNFGDKNIEVSLEHKGKIIFQNLEGGKVDGKLSLKPFQAVLLKIGE
ncbi:MAG: alpha-glucosidase C-terminal domain-containing protein, partial [Eubacterium sp.]